MKKKITAAYAAEKIVDNMERLNSYDDIVDYIVDELGFDPSVKDISAIENELDEAVIKKGVDKDGWFRDFFNDFFSEADDGNVCGVAFGIGNDLHLESESGRIRSISGLSRIDFSKKYHIPVRTLENWDAGIKEPPAYVLELLERAVVDDFGKGASV